MGVRSLREIQLGKESVSGTPVTCTHLWRGTGTSKDTRETVFAEEDIGLLQPLNRVYTPKLSGEVTVEGDATYENLVWVSLLSLGDETPTKDGSGTGYTWAWTAPLTIGFTPVTATVKSGDDVGIEQGAYGYCSEFTLSGAPGQALKISATIQTRGFVSSSLDSIAALAVHEILFGKGSLYINPATLAFGTTIDAFTLLGFELNYKTGIMPVYTADGALTYAFLKNVRPEVTLKITFEHNAIAATERAAWRAGTSRRVRLVFTGVALFTAGAETTYELTLDTQGNYESFDALDDMDGNTTVTATLRGNIRSASDQMFAINIVNESATVPA